MESQQKHCIVYKYWYYRQYRSGAMREWAKGDKDLQWNQGAHICSYPELQQPNSIKS